MSYPWSFHMLLLCIQPSPASGVSHSPQHPSPQIHRTHSHPAELTLILPISDSLFYPHFRVFALHWQAVSQGVILIVSIKQWKTPNGNGLPGRFLSDLKIVIVITTNLKFSLLITVHWTMKVYNKSQEDHFRFRMTTFHTNYYVVSKIVL